MNASKNGWHKSSNDPTADNVRVQSPTFLVGAERSGTTLLRLILDHHPQITWINEFAYALDWVPSEGWPDLQDYRRKLARDRVFRSSGLSVNSNLGYVDLVNDFLVQWRRRACKPIVGAQVHRKFDKLLRLWPEARFIHLVRDPRDVARSRIQMGWAGNTWHATRAWIEAERQWSVVRQNVPEDRQIDVYYEKLVRQSEQEIRRISQFIGVPFEPVMLEFHRDTTYDPINPNLSEQWRQKLTAWQIQLVETDAAEMMQERGYEISGLPHIHLGKLTRMALVVQDKFSRTHSRIRKYGPWLWLADVVSRRTGSESWRRQVLSRLMAIDRAHLR